MLGHAIVLLVVVILLSVYRQLDKNNRSLEKVKRYVEKAEGELDRIVQDKATMIKDMGIELEVHQRAAREILKRLQSGEQGLSERADAFAAVTKKIDEYDRTVDELVEMTRRAEENINRVRDESEYVDKVGRRIKAAQARMEELESKVPSIVHAFEISNEEKLNVVRDTALLRIDEKAESLTEQIGSAEARVHEFESFVSDLEDRARGFGDSTESDLRELYDRLLEQATLDAERIREEFSAEVARADHSVELFRENITGVERQYEERLEELAEKGRTFQTDALAGLKETITSEVEKARGELSERIDFTRAELETARDSVLEDFEKYRLDGVENLKEIKADLDEKADSLESALYELERTTGDRISQADNEGQERASEVTAALEAELIKRTDEVRIAMDKRVTELNESASASHEQIDGMFEELRKRVDDWTTRTNNYISELEEQVRSLNESSSEAHRRHCETIDRHIEETRARIDEYEGGVASSIEELKKRLGETDDTVRREFDRISRDVESATEAMQRELEQGVAQARESSARRLDEFADEIAKNVETIHAHIVETRTGLENQLEEVHADGKRLAEDTKTIFEEHVREVKEGVDADNGRVAEIRAEINQRIAELNSEVTKNVADVSSAILRHRNELSRDLTSAVENIEKNVVSSVEKRLEEYEDSVTYRFNRIESVNSDLDDLERNLRDSMDRVTARLREEFNAFGRELAEQRSADKSEADGHLRAIRDEMQSIETGIAELKQRAYDNVSEKLKVFEDEFFTDLRERSAGMESRVTEWQTEITRRLDVIGEEGNRKRTELESAYTEELRGSLAELQERVSHQFERFESGVKDRIVATETTIREFEGSARNDITEIEERNRQIFEDEFGRYTRAIENEFETFRSSTHDRIDRLKDEFESTISTVDTAISSQRDTMDAISLSLDTLSSDLAEKTRDALSDFTHRYNDLKNQIERDAHDLIEEATGASREFKSFVTETRDNFSTMQTRMFAKLHDETNDLAATLKEIDKKQRAFAEQTKIFERADTLKISLTENIEELKSSITRVESQRGEIREIESQFGKIRKLASEAGDKLGKFMAEKRRIDVLDDDYKKLMSLSQTVDLKLETLTANHDAVQTMQAQLRNLEELEKDVESRFERLEKKRGIIDVTTEGVDRNFQALENIESRLTEISSELETLPDRVEELSTQLRSIAAGKKEADQAARQLTNLEKTLGSIEQRMESLNTAREWLARTETRLEEVRQEAEDQVKLLGTILKDENKAAPRQKGAPSLSARDTVTKLARQGWNVDEISRAVKIGRGEVELILEINSKK